MDEDTFRRQFMGIRRPVMLGPLQVVITDTLPDGKKWNINDYMPWWEKWGPDDSPPKICMPPVVWEFLEDHFRLDTREGWQRLDSCGEDHFFRVLLPHARDRAVRYLTDKSYVQFIAHQLKGRLKSFENVPLTQTVQREIQMIVQEHLRVITGTLELERWLPEPHIVVAHDPCDPTKLHASINYLEPQNPIQKTILERLMSDFNGVVGTVVNPQQPRPTQVHYRVGEYEGDEEFPPDGD